MPFFSLLVFALLTGCTDAPPNDTRPEDTGDTPRDTEDTDTDTRPPYTTRWGSIMVSVEPGTFTMGGGRGDPRGSYADQQVTLTHAFWIGEHEVTEDEWGGWTDAPDGIPPEYEGSQLPVQTVSWPTAALYANALSEQEGLSPCYIPTGEKMVAAYTADPYSCRGYRLPTEAEWEYVARAGEDTTYSGSDTIGEVAWYAGNSDLMEHDVCTLETNAWGLCDMSGNAYEWTNDWHGPLDGTPATDPGGPSSGETRVLRGGMATGNEELAFVAFRNFSLPDDPQEWIGFRLARTSPGP